MRDEQRKRREIKRNGCGYLDISKEIERKKKEKKADNNRIEDKKHRISTEINKFLPQKN